MILATAILPCAASGATDAAWDAFRADVEASCRALVASPDGASVEIEVNPFGSDRFGAAIVSVRKGESEPERSLCIYEKQTGHAELTGPFAPATE